MGNFPSPADEHRTLACPELGLPNIEELLFVSDRGGGAMEAICLQQSLTQWLGAAQPSIPCRGIQPSSPLLLVHVVDGAAEMHVDETEDQLWHVWRVPDFRLPWLFIGNPAEVVELSAGIEGVPGRLLCVSYRQTLPVVTGKVYQKFYTQYVHARCAVCKTSPPIPTLCLLCGTFLCCNSECCRRPLANASGEMAGQAWGEVTQHAQTCGFGTCIFLQLSNSLVHIVADGFIACWGSLYLDGHGEEEYNLSRPLHISEARLQQLTQSMQHVSFDFESRLKWKKVIFV